MSSTTFILLGVTYYVFALILIIIVLNMINRKENNRYQDKINTLERDKNLIISAGILTELNKVENLINNSTMQDMFDDWQTRRRANRPGKHMARGRASCGWPG